MEVPLSVIIMAAGKGTRMKNPDVAKVMYAIDGKPMIEHVVRLAMELHSARTVVIVGWQKDSVITHLAGVYPSALCVEQNPQLGTGHAVMQAEALLADFEGDVLVLSGDVPLLRVATARSLVEAHQSTSAAATLLTTLLPDASGYGRILRSADGLVEGIVEHKDATEEQKAIREINSGIYVFDKRHLFEALKQITTDNAQHEYYLTDVFGYFWRNKLPVRAVEAGDPLEVRGVNTFAQLEEARGVFVQRR
jgi:UDP-N-acetylglucosamine pyrophosphorylase